LPIKLNLVIIKYFPIILVFKDKNTTANNIYILKNIFKY